MRKACLHWRARVGSEVPEVGSCERAASELERQPRAGGMRAGVVVQPGAVVFGPHLQERTWKVTWRGLVDGLDVGVGEEEE